MTYLHMVSFDNVVWESYIATICTWDSGYFFTTAPLVYDMTLEVYCPVRVWR
jgi:hypothetical protein